jgi:hypothetical protein
MEFYYPDPLVDWMVGYGFSMDPCWVNIHKGIHTGNKLSTLLSGIHTGDGVPMAGYSVAA